MCTVLLRFAPGADEPVIVAANRDEFRDRPADDPMPLGHGIFAGRDRRAGGTWLGVGRGGVAAVTNVRGGSISVGAPSRGALPLAALQGRLARHFDAWNAFNLLVATPDRAEVTTHDPRTGTSQHVVLTPGDWVVVNEPFGVLGPRTALARAALARLGPTVRALATHADDVEAALCRHGDVYGTVCTTVVALDRAGSVARYHYRRGLACAGPLHDLTDAAAVATGGTTGRGD